LDEHAAAVSHEAEAGAAEARKEGHLITKMKKREKRKVNIRDMGF
jgi:hypothetical protein